MNLSEYPSFWITTFTKRTTLKTHTLEVGIISTLLASLIISIISAIIKYSEAGTIKALDIFFLPIVCIVGIVLFGFLAHLFCKGKGTAAESIGITGTYAGSLIFVSGIITIVIDLLLKVVTSQSTAAATDVTTAMNALYGSMASMMTIMGIQIAVIACLGLIVYVTIVQLIAKSQKVELEKAAFASAVSFAVLLFVACVIMGVWIQSVLPSMMSAASTA